jgi:L-alanine-DL-glutamate epimerase-like enolase superfamily enzyme
MPEAAPVIDCIAASAFRIPTDAPEADGTLNWDHTTLVVAEVSAGGVHGLGYTYAGGQAASLINEVFAALLSGADAFAIGKAWERMFAAVRILVRVASVPTPSPR